MHINFDKKWRGYVLGDFFSQNSSGHPASYTSRADNSEKLNKSRLQQFT
jgi:hypothetical protein